MIGWIAMDYFARSPVLILPVVALFVFMVVFVVISIRTLFRDRRHMDTMARLPLNDDGK